MTKLELLEQVPKARRNKIEEEITNIVTLMAPHLEALIPIEKEFEDIGARYGRLKVPDGIVTKLLEEIFREKHPILFVDFMKNEEDKHK